MNAPTEAAFDEAWETLTIMYVKTFPKIITYFENYWLRDYKRKFVKA
jgi:hypothetical protein